MDAGGSAVEFNSPMSQERGLHIGRFAVGVGSSIVDLGCGYGALALLIASHYPDLKVAGIDSDRVAIEHGQAVASDFGLEDRLRFIVGDADHQQDSFDIAVSIGSSHAFGGTREMFEALKSIGSKGAVVGDMIWTGTPTPGLAEDFGELPVGTEALARMAAESGWIVEETSESTLAEWDEFEGGWIDGVRKVGTPQASHFADERADMYQQYRGIAGFGWVYLSQ